MVVIRGVVNEEWEVQSVRKVGVRFVKVECGG